MYFRAAPGKAYVCGLTVLSAEGGQQIEVQAKAFSQEGTILWEERFPKREILRGDNEIEVSIQLPEFAGRETIYQNGRLDTEIQLAIEAGFSSLNSGLVISRVELARADSQGTTQNPELVFDGTVIQNSGPLVQGQRVEMKVKKPGTSRLLVEGHCAGSHRLLWYCRQTNIDWQVRNAPVADHGAYLEIDAPTNVWSTDKEIVIVPSPNTHDELYVHRLKNVTQARIWPLNRGNQDLSVEILDGDNGPASVDIRSARKPSIVTGASRWDYSDGRVHLSIPVGKRATVIL